ncbi:MAG: TraB/GumN family protein [Bacteroidetes bacterium]|nr:MAG: TraB/GumN family protein [Bacteroidota bacterium]
MKKIVLTALAVGSILLCDAQTKASKKYPSLFWEITGNGLSRPSYLFGTMHVSSKMVFHLPDSFYLGIKNCDVVALETNPESWQEDLVKYDVEANSYGRPHFPWNNFSQMPDDYLNIRTLQFDKYEKQIEAALYSRPSTINNLLYRNYSDYSSDFEENTYLDMYIYQVGKKMGKQVAGVERYDESMKLMMEAYRDAAKEKNHKQRSYDNDDTYSADKLQEAYRTGNLDLLDSINRMNSFSAAFDEKFLYRRNLLQANSIDSILKSRSSLFVGVGAAHLPGTRGVIEILRRMGYKLRPIVMGETDSDKKDVVEKLRVPVNFNAQVSEDGFIKCDIPGKFYRFNEEGLLDQMQYADMANGSYYMVTRIKTNCGMWGQDEDAVKRKIDSLLYENIPGKILSKQEIVRNGYKGLDILNRTRRGDVQRYNIFITPYEVIIFKMSGNGEYVKDGDESKRFFGSIRLKEYNPEPTGWKQYQPLYGGFSVDLPHEPFASKGKNWQYQAEDKSTGTTYTIVRTDVHNYNFAEEDTFDLALLDESFSNSEFIDKRISRKLITWKGYASLDCKYLHKDGSLLLTRFLIQGPHYYTLIAHGRKENDDMQRFLNSFQITPLIYKEPFEKKDTSLCYSVKTTFYPEDKKIKISIPGQDNSLPDIDDDDDGDDQNNLPWGSFRNSVVENDSTGEKIYVSCYKSGRYYYNSDSSRLDENRISRSGSWIVRSKKKYRLPDGWRILEFQLSDTNSSRMIWTKSFYRSGVGFSLVTEGDTLSAPSSFVKSFFETFTPDTLNGFNPFEKKSTAFFNDFFSKDTTLRKRAVKSIDQVEVDSADFPHVKRALATINWSDKKYLQTKKSLVNKLGAIKTKSSSDLLKEIYYAAGDTIEMQYAALESLLQQHTRYSFSVFRDIVTAEPPVIDVSPGNSDFSLSRFRFNVNSVWGSGNDNDGDFWDDLYDSIRLTRSILPGMLPLLNLDDYKWRTMRLLGRMIDSNLVSSSDYDIYFSKFLLEARQELKKQAITEKKKMIKKAADKNIKANEDDDDDGKDYGNEKLALYAKLLMPFWNSNENVPVVFYQLLALNDKKIRYNTALLMIKNNKPVADSVLNYFAATDEYRYSFYNDLQEIGQLKFFPSKYNNKIDLAKSKLLCSKPYGKPDSVAFIEKLPAEFKSKQGYMYFFKYKEKKDDPAWKLAYIGLISKDPKQFEVCARPGSSKSKIEDDDSDDYNFTSFTDTKLNEDKSRVQQLSEALKKLIYSHRKSAKEFYDVSKNDLSDILRMRN